MEQKPMLQFVVESLNDSKGGWREIADAAAVPYSTLCKIAQGHIENPGISHVQSLYDHFKQKAAA